MIKGTLNPGLTLTLLTNTSADPIGGTFSNLPDGATIITGAPPFRLTTKAAMGMTLR